MIDRTNKYYLTTAEMLVMRAIWLADHDLVLNEVVRDCNAAYGKDWRDAPGCVRRDDWH